MNAYDDLKLAFSILEKYTEYEGYLSAEHEAIWLGGPPPSVVSEEDQAELEKHCIWWDSHFESWFMYT